MSNTETKTQGNPLGSAPIGPLLRKFAIPSIIAMLVSALYNIVDQIFIGQSIGELGNAAVLYCLFSNNIEIMIALAS